jgi:hypothetical protein
MGIHSGSVFRFWDPGRKDWNFIGEGINGGQRVLSAAGKETDDVIYVSAQTRQLISASDAQQHVKDMILLNMVNRGRKEDKHKMPWRVYEINHMAVCRHEQF